MHIIYNSREHWCTAGNVNNSYCQNEYSIIIQLTLALAEYLFNYCRGI